MMNGESSMIVESMVGLSMVARDRDMMQDWSRTVFVMVSAMVGKYGQI